MLALAGAANAQGSPASREGVEFFERRVRPLLAEHCYRCHGGEKHENDLFLNSSRGITKGGDRGTPVVAGKPDESWLIRAVRYTDDDLKMPPRGKLSGEQIADLVQWVKLGAPLPPDPETTPAAIQPSSTFDLAQRRQHWSYQPVRAAVPPSVKGGAWCRSPVDAFLRHKVAAAGLAPAAAADRRTLIRRLTFDLTGLPPLPADVAAFLADESPDAHERLVDRLLATPAYGERWARHWLDVVRYSETLGFEFDYDLYNAWRYRDYVIRAMNSDLPYDQFVIEHLAGDLVREPRRTIDGCNESILATGFFWMLEGKQTPVDIRQEQMDRIDNQIDTLGKAFLGQTIACARCHDHKFDAISTRDYYALAGYLRSSRYQQAFLDPPERFARQLDELAALREQISRRAPAVLGPAWQAQLQRAGEYLAAARRAAAGMEGATESDRQDAIRAAAREAGLEATRLARWVQALGQTPRVAAAGAAHESAELFEDFRDSTFVDWFATGEAFGAGPPRPSEIVVGQSSERPIARLATGGADSGAIALRLQGELRSRTFTIDKPFLHVRLSGKNARVNLVIDGNTLIMDPMYGKLTATPGGTLAEWKTMPVDRWVGRRAYLELSDSTIPMHRLNPPPSTARVPEGKGDGYLAVEAIWLSETSQPPGQPFDVDNRAIEQAAERWASGKAEASDLAVLNWLLESGVLDGVVGNAELADLLARYRGLAASLPLPERAPALADGTGEDEFVFLRGNHRTPGEPARRGPPEVLCGIGHGSHPSHGTHGTNGTNATEATRTGGAGNATEGVPYSAGSGRLELARSLADPANPLLARVIVNRTWQHHFGSGIVRTPDDFGRMGEVPSHPELLDYLATELVQHGWSLKALHRKLVTSTAYRMSSNPQSPIPNPQSLDPDNRLLSHMPIRRLEAEAIRDTILAVSGRLNAEQHGPSVLPFVTQYMEGRGRPNSGPLDAGGRRSIYVNARRNFLTPLLLAFDYPVTFTPIGRRGTSAIPAQALTLMNDPFVVQQSGQWAQRVLAEAGNSDDQRLEFLFDSAFARPPTDAERASSREFLQQQAARRGATSSDVAVWTDLCHVLINVKEFIFID
jgi:hypothetical protein